MKRAFVPKKMKILVFSDSPLVTSGFGNVNRMIVDGFVKNSEIFDTYVLGGLDRYPNYDKMKTLPYHYWPPEATDPGGDSLLVKMAKDIEPERIFMLADPGSLARRAKKLFEAGIIGPDKKAALISYFPVEGLPLFPSVVNAARLSTVPYTYCKFGEDAIAEYKVDISHVYHGWDHAPFKEYKEEERDHLRDLFAIEDDLMFVGMVGVNKRTNCYPKVFEAMRYIKDNYPEEYEHIIIYIHAQKYDSHALQGYDLRFSEEQYGVQGSFLFKPDQEQYKYNMAEAFKENELDYLLNMSMSTELEERSALWANSSYITKMNTFDVLLDVASCHGFNLPILEASICGVPSITVNDGFARSEIYGDVAYMMEHSCHDFWHTGVRLMHVSPETIGESLVDFYRNLKEYRVKYGKAAQIKFLPWTWDKAQKEFNHAMMFCEPLSE